MAPAGREEMQTPLVASMFFRVGEGNFGALKYDHAGNDDKMVLSGSGEQLVSDEPNIWFTKDLSLPPPQLPITNVPPESTQLRAASINAGVIAMLGSLLKQVAPLGWANTENILHSDMKLRPMKWQANTENTLLIDGTCNQCGGKH
jgi:hypothetical protein